VKKSRSREGKRKKRTQPAGTEGEKLFGIDSNVGTNVKRRKKDPETTEGGQTWRGRPKINKTGKGENGSLNRGKGGGT